MQPQVISRFDDLNQELLGSLNPEQYNAVTTLDKALLVLSGAGTGKTKVLTTKIAYIIENGYAFPSQILAVTFSNRAAKEMKERLSRLTSGANEVWLGTFHSVCAKILRRHAELIGISNDFTIIDTDDQTKLIKQIVKELNLDKKIVNRVVNKISRWKDKGLTSNDLSIDASSVEGKIYKIYQEMLKNYDSMDFGDLLLNVIQLFKKFPDIVKQYREKFKYILVDEYQDTNIAQYVWLRMLTPIGKGLCCVGDDDQAIYSWRGAEVGNILRFEHDFLNTEIVRLEKNYRSDAHILGAASSLISNNENRFGKTIWTDGDIGEKVAIRKVFNGLEEAQDVAIKIENLRHRENVQYDQMAILVRAGFQTREFEDCFIRYDIPYRVIGGLKFYDRQEIKDIVAYIRLIYQPNDSLAFERIVNVPKRGIGDAAVGKFYAYARDNGISLYQAACEMAKSKSLRDSLSRAVEEFSSFIESLRERKDLSPANIAKIIVNDTGYFNMLQQEQTVESRTRIENLKELITALEDFPDIATFMEHVSLVVDSPKNLDEKVVNIMTLHSAKGLEFDTVFLAGWEEGVFPHSLSLQEGNLEEERRLAYVGITRARKRAFITYALSRRIHNQWQNNQPSRFLFEMSKDHIVVEN